MNNIESKVEKSFIEGLGLDSSVNVRTIKYRDIPQWDSVGHMQLVSQLETDFDIMLETKDVVDLSSFDKAVEIVKKYGA